MRYVNSKYFLSTWAIFNQYPRLSVLWKISDRTKETHPKAIFKEQLRYRKRVITMLKRRPRPILLRLRSFPVNPRRHRRALKVVIVYMPWSHTSINAPSNSPSAELSMGQKCRKCEDRKEINVYLRTSTKDEKESAIYYVSEHINIFNIYNAVIRATRDVLSGLDLTISATSVMMHETRIPINCPIIKDSRSKWFWCESGRESDKGFEWWCCPRITLRITRIHLLSLPLLFMPVISRP